MKSTKLKYPIVIALLLIISIGFAYLTTTLEINGIAGIRKNTWKIYFDNVVNLTGSSLATTAPTTSGNTTKKISYRINLNEPGDEYRFNVDIVNDGSLNAMITVLTNSSITEEQQKYISYSVTYADETPLATKNLLPKADRDTLLVSVIYKDNISSDDLPSTDEDITLDLIIKYEQADNTAVARSTSQLNVKYDYNYNLISDFDDQDDSTISAGVYNIKNNVFTLTAKKDDAYVITDYTVSIISNHKYYFTAEIDGKWGGYPATDTQEVFLISDTKIQEGRISDYAREFKSKESYFKNNYTDIYHIRFDCNINGATHSFWNLFLTEYSDSNFDVGANITLPNATREGYTLDGWYTDRVGGTKITTNDKVNYSTTYYAHWTEA